MEMPSIQLHMTNGAQSQAVSKLYGEQAIKQTAKHEYEPGWRGFRISVTSSVLLHTS